MSSGRPKIKKKNKLSGSVNLPKPLPSDAIQERKPPGCLAFSPWYTPEYAREKVVQKQDAIAKMAERGEILGSVENWNERAKQRFGRLWDRLATETKRSYQSSIRSFGKYLGIRRSETDVSELTARLIMLSRTEAATLVEEYMMWLEKEEGLAPNSINNRLAALRWLVDSARSVGWIEWKLDVKGVKGGNSTDTSGPSAAEFRRIIRVVNDAEGAGAKRDRFLVYMLAFMGVRIASAISLDIENIDFDKRKFKLQWKGKGEGVERYVWRPVGPETFAALEDWLEIRGDCPGPVFTRIGKATPQSRRIGVRHAEKLIEAVGQEAATKKPLSPHAFRHFHATDALESEGDTRRVMKSTGHTSERVLLKHYDDSDDTAAREVSASMEDRWLSQLDEYEDEDEDEIQERYTNKGQVRSAGSSDDEEDMLAALGVVSSTMVPKTQAHARMSTGINGVDELLGVVKEKKTDRIISSGIVKGSLVLVGGQPGIGKSTILRQIAHNICELYPSEKVMYASGEETVEQISDQMERLECQHDRLKLIAESSVDKICEAAELTGVSVLILDSINTVGVQSCRKKFGSVTMVKAIAAHLMEWSKGVGDTKGSGITVFIICHVDKKGNISGPKFLEHAVDIVLIFTAPSRRSKMRSLLCEGKNRFGPATGEVVFEMTGRGLIERGKGSDDEEDNDDYD